MGDTRQHKLSLIRHAKELAALLTPRPVFVDLDAHAEMDELPKEDFLGISDFSMVYGDKDVRVFVSYACSTWKDPDLMRLLTMVDLVTEAVKPERKVDVWMEAPGGMVSPTWMISVPGTLVHPTDKTDQRALQLVTAQFISSRSGHS